MSSNDSTRPEGEGRTVATDADRAGQSPPERDAGRGSTVSDAEDSNGRPSPVPRAGVEPDVDAGPITPESATASANGTAAVADPPPATTTASSGPAEGPPPWRRVPGDQPAPVEEAERPTVADSLLSEAPTAFLAAPRATSAGSPERISGGRATAVADPGGAEDTGEGGVRASSRNRPPRQALLQLKRLDPWSVLKMALALAVVLFLVWMVAAGVLYGVLGGMGVWDRLNGTYADLVTGQAEQGGSLISAGRVFLLAAVVGFINSLLFAVAMTIGAFVYNVAADLVGGIEVTLSERD